ncbi:hypothetical protein L7F22_036771 [Adiantum nelumboides]|nr:hypothetical protein [Adiantum nelumboides]
MLSSLLEYKHEQCHWVPQSSPVLPPCFQPSDHGFVRAVFRAYSHHFNLVICPDDIWLAILVRFDFYVNTNAEAFHSLFVAHHGKKELTVSHIGSHGSADYARFMLDMVSQLHANIIDFSFCDLVLPRFSTIAHDTIAARVALMATMKKQLAGNKVCHSKIQVLEAQQRIATLEFPVIETSASYVTVVIVDDHGTEHKTLMFAGHLGYDKVQFLCT